MSVVLGCSTSAGPQNRRKIRIPAAKVPAGKKTEQEPTRLVQAAYNRATSAAEKLVYLVQSEEATRLAPEHIRRLRQMLQPVLAWINAHEPLPF